MSSDKEILTLHDNFEKHLDNIVVNPTCVRDFWAFYQKLSVTDALVALQPKVAVFLRLNLCNTNYEIRNCAIQLLGEYLSNGLFSDEKYTDIAVLIVDSVFKCNADGLESQELWLKLVQVFLLLRIDELVSVKPAEIKHVLCQVLNSDVTSGAQKAKALKMFQIYVKRVNFEEIDDIFPIWQNQIIPQMFNLQPDALNLATDLLPWAQNIVQKQNEQWELICSDIQKKYIPILLSQIYNKNSIYSTLWIFLIKLLTCKLHKGLPVINSLLSVVETAFKAQDKIIRIEAFHCWQGLIECFNFVPQEVYTKKRVKLLLIPLRTNNCKTEELIIAKFETWSRLFRVLHLKNAINSDVIEAYLYFCFGPLWDSPLKSDAAPNIATHGKKYPSLHYNSCLTFLQLLGDDKYFTDNINQTLSQLTFVRAKMSTKLFNSSSKTIIYAVGEACTLLSQIDKGECKALNEVLWKSLFLMIDATEINNKMAEDVSSIVQAIMSMARKKPILLNFGVLPIIKIILSKEFKFIANDSFIDSILVPFFGVLLKKNDQNLLMRCEVSIFKPIFEFRRSYKNYLKFLKNIFYKNALSLDVHLVVLAECHSIWFLILEELKTKYEDDANDLDLQSCFYELFKWPLSTLNAHYDEILFITWKHSYENYAKRTVSHINLAKSLIEYAYSLTEQNPEFIYIAELVHFIILQINLQNFTNENFEVIYDIITYLKQIISLPTLTADSATIYQKTVTHLLENCPTLPYLPRIIAPLVDILRNIINKHNKIDVIYALKSFVNTVQYSPELHPHMAQILALLKPLEGEQALIITKTIETKMKFEYLNISDANAASGVVRIFGQTAAKNDDFVYVTTPYQLDPRKLTKSQKEKLSRRRDDIPALYADLSQSQTRDFDSNSDCMPVLVAEGLITKDPQDNSVKTDDKNETASPEDMHLDMSTSESTSDIAEALRIDVSTESSIKTDVETDPPSSESTIIFDENVTTPEIETKTVGHCICPKTTPETVRKPTDKVKMKLNPLQTYILQKPKRKRKKPSVLSDFSLDLDEVLVKSKRKDAENPVPVRKRQKLLDVDEKILKTRLVDTFEPEKQKKKRQKGDDTLDEKSKKKRHKSSEMDESVDVLGKTRTKHDCKHNEKPRKSIESPDLEGDKLKKKRTSEDIDGFGKTRTKKDEKPPKFIESPDELKKKRSSEDIDGLGKTRTKQDEKTPKSIESSDLEGDKLKKDSLAKTRTKQDEKTPKSIESPNLEGDKLKKDSLAKTRTKQDEKTPKSIESPNLEGDKLKKDSLGKTPKSIESPDLEGDKLKKDSLPKTRTKQDEKPCKSIESPDLEGDKLKKDSLAKTQTKQDEKPCKSIESSDLEGDKLKKDSLGKTRTKQDEKPRKSIESPDLEGDKLKKDSLGKTRTKQDEKPRKSMESPDLEGDKLKKDSLGKTRTKQDEKPNKSIESPDLEGDKLKKDSLGKTRTKQDEKPRKSVESPDLEGDKLKKKRASEDLDAFGKTRTKDEKRPLTNTTDLELKVKRELNRLRIHVIAEHEYKNIEQRKTRSGILLDGPPTIAPVVASPKTRQLPRQKPNPENDPQTDSEPIIENTQEVDHHLKRCKVPLYRIEPVKPSDHTAIGNGNRAVETVKGAQDASSFKIVLVKEDPQVEENSTPEEKIDDLGMDSTEIGEELTEPLEMGDIINNLKIEEHPVKPECIDSSASMSSLKIEPDEYDTNLNITDTQTISTHTLDELNADAATPLQDDICRKVIFDVTDEDIPESDIPTSPLENDTPTRNRELLRSTAELSPIKLIFPENDEPIPKVPEISPILFNSETTEATDKSEKASTSFSKRSPRPCGSRGALIMDMVQARTGLDYSPMVKKVKHKVKKHVLSSPSVSHNRISKMMEQFEKPENFEIEADAKEEICENDMFSFSRNLPSPTANPAVGILRKRKEPDTSDDNIEPMPKRKRVNFADPPVSCRKFIEKNAKQKFSPELKQLDIIPNEPRVLRSSTQNADNPFQINDALTETADKIIQKYIPFQSDTQCPICPLLINCAEPIMLLIPNLTSTELIHSTFSLLDSKSIKTIGDLAQRTESQITEIPLNVETVKSVLNDYKANMTPVKPARKIRPISFKFADPKSCEVSVITSSNRDDTTTDFPDDVSDNSEERFPPNQNITDLSPNTVRNSILGEEILGANVQNILLSIIRVLNEKNYDPKPLLQMLFGGLSNLTDILVTMGTIRIHHLATIQNWSDIISDVITQIGIWDLMRLLSQLPQVPQALMFTALLNYSVNEIGADFICEHLNKNDVLKYVIKHYALIDIINEYDAKTIRQSVTELIQNPKYHNLSFKSILSDIIDNPRDLGVALSKLTVVEIGESIVQRFDSKVDLNSFIKQIYALNPAPLLDDLEPGADPINVTIDMIEKRLVSKTNSIKLFNCLAQQFSSNELLDLLYSALKTKI